MAAVMDKIKERRNRVFLGPLPEDFLRVTVSPQQQQEAADRQAAWALYHQISTTPQYAPNTMGRLSITVAQAKLAKNYGMTRMDPYARVRVGHCVYETHTDPNGGKNPRWNKVIQCLLPQGICVISLEIYDECSFTMDELIAWTTISIPQQVLDGQTHEEWYPLNGKQGEGVEGMINIVLSLTSVTQPYNMYPPVMVVPNVGGSRVPTPLTVYSAPPSVVPETQPQTLVLSAAALKQVEEMFPNIDKDLVRSIFEELRGDKSETINHLLLLN